MDFDNPVSVALDELRRDRDRLEQALKSLTMAMMYMNEVIKEVYEHNQEHHEVINDLGRVVSTLEELMIGGTDETPDA